MGIWLLKKIFARSVPLRAPLSAHARSVSDTWKKPTPSPRSGAEDDFIRGMFSAKSDNGGGEGMQVRRDVGAVPSISCPTSKEDAASSPDLLRLLACVHKSLFF